MPLTFSPEQLAFREAVRSFLADKSPEDEVRRLMATDEGYDAAVWAQLNEQLGAAGLAVPEEYGGSGYTFRELAIVLEEAGRSLLCAPLLSSVIASSAITASGDVLAAKELLPGIAQGTTIATVAFTHAGQDWDSQGATATARQAGGAGSWTVSGTAAYVIDGHTADLILVPASTPGGLSLFAVRAGEDGVRRSLLPTLDQTRKLAKLEFSGVPARLLGPEGAAASTLDDVRRVAAAALASEQAGVAEAAKEMAVQYAKDRVQFGKPIGSFQAVKHMLADALVDVEGMRSTAYYAAWCAAAGDRERSLSASMAKAWCSDASRRVMAAGLQVHGGIGFTWEHDMHLYLKRAQLDQVSYGDAAAHRDRIATLLRARLEAGQDLS
jgi:alkylation response protein AidB-like acyl-CoA dehydrogenase